MNAAFEGSYLGDSSKLDDGTSLECGICWQVYDPALGDSVAQVSPGTPFAALPDDWRCPSCDAPKQKFLVLGTARGTAAGDDAVLRLVAAYRNAATEMRGLPVYNPQLIVEALGFMDYGERRVGVMVTPWFMNIAVLPGGSDQQEWAAGRSLRLTFPSGAYDFLVSELDGVGLVASCSLFSPMNDFTDHEAARLAATAAFEALLQPDPEEAVAEPPAAAAAPVSRRAFLSAGG